jgi:hypothetical protein
MHRSLQIINVLLQIDIFSSSYISGRGLMCLSLMSDTVHAMKLRLNPDWLYSYQEGYCTMFITLISEACSGQ